MSDTNISHGADKGVDIYWDGNIYTDIDNHSYYKWFHNFQKHNDEFEAFLKSIPASQKHDCPAPHPFKDGQQVVLRKDYELRYERLFRNTWVTTDKESWELQPEPNRRLVAIPIDNSVEGGKEIGFTAMQTLIDFGWKNLDSNPMSIIRFAEKLLPKEKEQIIQAWKDGEGRVYYPDQVEEQANKYFNETFK